MVRDLLLSYCFLNIDSHFLLPTYYFLIITSYLAGRGSRRLWYATGSTASAVTTGIYTLNPKPYTLHLIVVRDRIYCLGGYDGYHTLSLGFRL